VSNFPIFAAIIYIYLLLQFKIELLNILTYNNILLPTADDSNSNISDVQYNIMQTCNKIYMFYTIRFFYYHVQNKNIISYFIQ